MGHNSSTMVMFFIILTTHISLEVSEEYYTTHQIDQFYGIHSWKSPNIIKVLLEYRIS
jgi:hypothetical protein